MLSATATDLAGRMAAGVLAAAGGEPAPASPAAPPGGFEALAERILFATVDVGLALTFVGLLLCIARLLRGPTLIDRAVASDSIALQVVALVVLLSIRFSTIVEFDAVLIVSILGFVSTVAFAQFIGRRGAAA